MPNDDYQTTNSQQTAPTDSTLDGQQLNKELSAHGFNDNPINFYRILTPQDSLGRVKPAGGGASFAAFGNSVSDDQKLILYEVYIKNVTSGMAIINKLGPLVDIPTRGVGYQTVAIDTTGRATFLDKEYWTTKTIKPSGDAGAGQQITVDAYYQNLADRTNEPGVEVNINVLRMPLLTDARKNTDEISMFLNYMPSTFASNMVPYFDVEFQMPRSTNEIVKDETGATVKMFLQRPSILRFLLGSVPPQRKQSGTAPGVDSVVNLLSDADAALLATTSVPRSKKQLSPDSPRREEVYITGMEMFTTPQTLTNMDSLREGEGRLNDVKPFLPPATLSSANITLNNTGVNTSKWQANLELKIHDKARLVEFSEFIRGPSGIQDVTIWLTFGWLAPRGALGPDLDAYAKFVNETMLVRYPFTVKNSSFSFEAAGIVSLKLDLIGKAVASLEYGKIDTFADDKKNILRQLPGIIAEIKELRKSYNNKKSEAAAAVGRPTDNRLYEIFDAAEAANLEPSIPPSELLTILKDEMVRLESEKPVNEKAIRLIRRLWQLYEYDPQTKKPKIKSDVEGAAKNFAKSRFDAFRKKLDDDPFLPSNLVIKNTTQEPVTERRIFSVDLVSKMSEIHSSAATDKTTSSGGGSGTGTGGGGRGGYGGGGKRATPKKDPYVFGTAHGVTGVDGRDTDAKILDYWNHRVFALNSESDAYQISQGGSIDDEQYKKRLAQDVAQLRAMRDREREDLRRRLPMEPGTGPLA